jgi:tetratricopeptide (TPR) repeat protein
MCASGHRIVPIPFVVFLALALSFAALAADQPQTRPDAIVAETMAVHLADKNDCMRQEARSALLRIGGPAVPVLVKALDHKQASVRRLAAETLGSIKPPAQDAVPALIARLKDSSPGVRTASLEALQRIGEPKEQIINAIASSLGDEDPDVREAAVNNLRSMGRDAIKTTPRLLKLKYNDSDEAVRNAAGVALDRVGPKAYFYCVFLVVLAVLSYHLFLRWRTDRLRALYAILPACFGHPIYLVLALFMMDKLGVSQDSHDLNLSGAVGYTTIVLLLFLLRFSFFLYLAWVNTRSSLEKVYRHAAVAYCSVHSNCIFGVIMFVWFLNPLDPSGGIVYVLVFFVTGIAGIIQSAYGLAQAFFPERWAPPDEIVVEHKKEGVVRLPLAPEETRKRLVAGALMGCLILLMIGAGVSLQMPDRKQENEQELHFRQMLARKKADSAEYHLMLGRSYAGEYPVNRSDDIKERYARAFVEYNKAIELDPNLAWAYKQRANAYSGLKDYARAVEDYNTFERLSDVVDWQLYGSRARAYRALGMYDKMCEDSLKECCGDYSRDSYKKLVEEGLCKY